MIKTYWMKNNLEGKKSPRNMTKTEGVGPGEEADI